MSKVKKTGLLAYEILFIVSGKFTENEVPSMVEKIESLISEKGGEITYKESWGKKRLAYPIQGLSYGYYTLLNFKISGEKIFDIDKAIRLSSEIVRHQVVRQFQRKAATTRPERIRPEHAKQDKEELHVEQSGAEKPKEAKKVDLKDLDEKLDKILDVESLL